MKTINVTNSNCGKVDVKYEYIIIRYKTAKVVKQCLFQLHFNSDRQILWFSVLLGIQYT